ncbi:MULTISPECIES: OsmC family protein [Arthrobacter]|jgi:lipoyl-dependent peroxiredoxin|uniref:OsmC family protein n=1 Tax=Arthrobacter TaxID=1663 RepID=UPI0009912E80|nr:MULTISPECIES: OsmC family protein [Arthrobacter]MCI0141636.1 OsmC family protein [Arthrobacter bambusae]MDQ0211273.1 osmotically inducible protein OsmC [Arthrobacter bambusae]MDQ0235587.1 osmotically inducible protein OsmC [Arthrobacter bambusae]MDQ0241760.1 osmotically inducible protein OsmC [Arthrobacter bambusae]OOP64697.1 peroxiredoxin [Arthrobacter sp. SRS-W-1-2016]
MATTRTAHTVWNGNLIEGAGNTTLDSSGLGTFNVTWKARAESAEGKTSPEELIAAAHSACFSMAFSNGVAGAGFTPEEVNTKADVTFQPGEGITGIHLTVSARIPGVSEEEFQRLAEDAKLNCPVSQALRATPITLDATLAS